MFVKNTGPKVLGFGKLALMPGASCTLPTGYDEKHPTIAFYIKKGWLASVSQSDCTADEAEAKLKAEEVAAQKAAQLDKKLREVEKMSLEQLKTEATTLGIAYPTDVTKAILVDLITKKLTEE